MQSKSLSCTRLITLLVTLFIANAALAARYISPSGYLEIIGYKLQLDHRDGNAELSVTGSVQALSDCPGAIMVFDVMSVDKNKVGTIKVSRGPFFRHDRWALGPGEFTPQGDDAGKAMATAHHVVIREAECTKRQ